MPSVAFCLKAKTQATQTKKHSVMGDHFPRRTKHPENAPKRKVWGALGLSCHRRRGRRKGRREEGRGRLRYDIWDTGA